MSAKRNKSKKDKPEPTMNGTNGPYPCPECEEELETLSALRAHLTTHIPKREKSAVTVILILEANGKSMEQEELMQACHAANPTTSKLGHKGYSAYINKLRKEQKVVVKTIVELV